MGRLLDEDMVINALQTTKFRNDLFVDRGYARAISIIKELPTIQPEKTQLSKEGTTSDSISRTETVEHLRRVLEATVPNTDCDEGFIDGIEFGISTVSTMPPAHPEPQEGHWINGKCDLCGEHAPFWSMASTYHESSYCPNCGARMVKGERQK